MSAPFAYDSSGLRVAQAVGLTSSAFLSGFIFSISTITVPAILPNPPSTILKSWSIAYNRGKMIAPSMALTSALANLYVAYKTEDVVPVVAAALAIGIVPWTILVMLKTNKALMEREQRTRTVHATTEVKVEIEEEGVRALTDRWATLNLVRAGLVLSSAAVAAWRIFF
ncbi:hypothetical protein L228DRAFT_281540 [Xylona heveae TC161]|uniref:DUF1772-domain-containing protein n=1 Tax=Xylona heveae (strain CBS 132557 / TC161) TaxID=1328760 RepID=A0A165I6T4_XYLHT|nr:hypothetical protein L228DRAFT_281540 [Xylona heveae TC161]KZF24471.1 hypothetical protein L228DRAFT_281540 [Xylona heveae TC161]